MRARSRPARSGLQGWAMFAVDPAFETGSVALADLPLCAVRLQLDARFPWLILIPRVADARELEDLAPGDRAAFIEEIVQAGGAVRAMGEALGWPVAKLNVGALGNITPQLHAHVVGRRPDDAAWPGPVWGFGAPRPYDAETLASAKRAAMRNLAGLMSPDPLH
jgi:diadenosine tetraphosphate (Ap4A) HIT family hydrolase